MILVSYLDSRLMKVDCFLQGCIKLSIPPAVGGWNKIKRFGDGEENQKFEKKKKKLKI